jgi:transcription initiation factor IIF auxiliary subunit
VFKKPPFRIEEKGWGEFDMTITLSTVHKGGEHTLEHDLNFQTEKYEAKHTVVSDAAGSLYETVILIRNADLPEPEA